MDRERNSDEEKRITEKREIEIHKKVYDSYSCVV